MTRRSFLDMMAQAIRGVVAALAGVPVVQFLLSPFRTRNRGGGFVRLVPLSTLQPNTAKRVTVVSDRWDSFTHYPPGPVGSVWLVREDQGDGDPRVRCLQTICPHLGCAVDQDGEGEGFRCPCHGASFDETGKIVEGPSPRGMDELDVRIAKGDEGLRWVEVRYLTFVTGTERMTPKV